MINLSNGLTLSLEEAQKLKAELSQKIQEAQEHLAKTQQERAESILNAEDFLENFRKAAKKMLKALSQSDFPEHGICSHFGISEWVGNDVIGFSEHHNQLLVTIYRQKNQTKANGGFIGYSKRQHEMKMEAVAEALNATVKEHWNGNERSTGVSFVLDMPVPKALCRGIKNYRNQRNVFDPTKDESKAWTDFRVWLEKGLKEDA